MSKKQPKTFDPLRPRFPRAALLEITSMVESTCMSQFTKVCHNVKADAVLTEAAKLLARDRFNVARLPDMSSTYPIEVAIGVAALKLDDTSPTRSESILAALFEQTIAKDPNSAGTLSDALRKQLSEGGRLTLERDQAITQGFKLAEQVARFSRVPRLYASRPNLPEQVFADAQEMALAMDNPRVAVIKTVEAMNRLRSWHRANDRDPKEGQAILTLAEKLYKPLAEAINWRAASDKIGDYIFRYRQQDARREIKRQVEERMGEGCYESEAAILDAGVKVLKGIVEHSLNRDKPASERVTVEVQGRMKQPASVHKKLQKKQAEKPGYTLDDMTDLLAFRVVIPNDPTSEEASRQMCYRVAEVVKSVFKPDMRHYADYISDGSKVYESIHVVGQTNGQIDPRFGIAMPGELVGKVIEVQIRDTTMDHTAEVGAASHRGYKAGAEVSHTHLVRSEYVRRSLSKLNRGEVPRESPADEVFLVDREGQPHRIERLSSLMDAAFTLDPKKGMFVRQLEFNGVTVDMNSPIAADAKVKNGDMVQLVTDSVDTSKPPASFWLRRGVMKSVTARTVLLEQIGKSRIAATRAARRSMRSVKPGPGES